MQKSKIEWTDMTWNPVTGCKKVSEGCRFCYAETFAKRQAGRNGYDKAEPFKVTERPERLDEPRKVKTPQRIFVCSMGDLFHREVTWPFTSQIHDVMRECPQHTFLVLTKRPGVAQAYYEDTEPPPSNVWLGVSVESQFHIDRVETLAKIPAAVRWVSFEPLLSEIDPTDMIMQPVYREGHSHGGGIVSREMASDAGMPEIEGSLLPETPGEMEWCPGSLVDWVVIGGESGPKARVMHPNWARRLIREFDRACVPIFFKQWGSWLPLDEDYPHSLKLGYASVDGELVKVRSDVHEGILYARTGKAKAGRMIDGREWTEYPKT